MVICFCDEWILKARNSRLSVEFKCPVHGDVKIDARRLHSDPVRAISTHQIAPLPGFAARLAPKRPLMRG
jgi:hypothetical protein